MTRAPGRGGRLPAGSSGPGGEAAGATAQDALAFYKAPVGAPPIESIGGINGLGEGKSGFMSLDLQPGAYAAVCLIPDPSSGVAHIHLGMFKAFSVKG